MQRQLNSEVDVITVIGSDGQSAVSKAIPSRRPYTLHSCTSDRQATVLVPRRYGMSTLVPTCALQPADGVAALSKDAEQGSDRTASGRAPAGASARGCRGHAVGGMPLFSNSVGARKAVKGAEDSMV